MCLFHLQRTSALALGVVILTFLPKASSFSPSPRLGPSTWIGSRSGRTAAQAAPSPLPKSNHTLEETLAFGKDQNDETINSSLSWDNSFATQQIGDLEALLTPVETPAFGKDWNLPSLPDIRACVIVPGFLTGKDEFVSMARSLNSMGIPTVVVPMPSWHWLPCLGGRSMRPMLERIDFTVRHMSACGNLGDFDRLTIEGLDKSLDDALIQADDDFSMKKDDPQLLIPNFSYSLTDCYHDFFNNPGGLLQVGGSAEVDKLRAWDPKGSFPTASEPMGKVALIGHSAGGWISRAYLSGRNYAGKFYEGQQLVHSLVTLGSPHANAPGPAFDGVKWVNSEVMDSSSGVRALAVGGKGYRGDSSGMLTKSSYAFCCPNKSDGSQYDGDGVTPIQSALSMKEYVPHADTLILDDVGHFCWDDAFGGEMVAPDLTKAHREGRPWYGDESIIEKWAGWL